MAKKKKKRTKYSWHKIPDQNKGEWKNLCPPNEYRILGREDVEQFIPGTLQQKTDSVFVMASGSPSGTTYLMLNINRVDFNDQAIDQQPFGIVLINEHPLVSGCFVHHGDWVDRTIKPEPIVWNQLNDCGIGNFYPILNMPTEQSGSIFDLSPGSQTEAFQKVIEQLKE